MVQFIFLVISKCFKVVFGEDSGNVKLAQEDLEYVKFQYDVDAEVAGWVLGKEFKNLNEIKQKAELTEAKWDREKYDD